MINLEFALTHDGSTYVGGQLADAVWMDQDGGAWLGTLTQRADGSEFVDGIVYRGQDQAAPDGWSDYVARRVGAEFSRKAA